MGRQTGADQTGTGITMQEGHVIESCSIEGTETRFRYPRWNDLDAFIDMHRTLTREKVMCRRLELDALPGAANSRRP